MALRILICDDSPLARKQMAKALPSDLSNQVTFAENGNIALNLLRSGEWDLLFLDLNMPEPDGYQVLSIIAREELPVMTIVVSGDIQPEAQARVRKLGALAFVKKPGDPKKLATLLTDYGLYYPESPPANDPVAPQTSQELPSTPPPTLQDCLQELANVAMGQASALLARLLGSHVRLPVPKAGFMARSEFEMAIASTADGGDYSIVSQGFSGDSLTGEALLLVSDSNLNGLARDMGIEAPAATNVRIDTLMELSGILAGAFIRFFGDQLDIRLGLGAPAILKGDRDIRDLLNLQKNRQEQLMCIEIRYEIEHSGSQCDLLLALNERSMPRLEKRLRYLMD